MKKTLLTSFCLLPAFCLLVVFAYLLPLPMPAYLDFQVLYHADLGLLQKIPLYDRAGQAGMIAHLAGVTPDQVFVLPFPYPPWYALSTIFLALPPVEVAARIWFGLNLFMLAVSVWLLTNWGKKKITNPTFSNFPSPNPSLKKFRANIRGFTGTLRGRVGVNVLNFLLAILFIPVLGSLYVGQYIFPVLLGAALMIFALCQESVTFTTLAFVLLTFKPHLGGPLVLAVLAYLFIHRDSFSRRALTAILVSSLFLFVVSFIADPAWPGNYLHSLFDFRDVPGVSTCRLCASLPIALVGFINGQTDLRLAFPIGAMLFILLTTGLFLVRRDLFHSPETLIPTVILISLLADPYLLNYDFTLLLIPLFTLSTFVRRMDWLWVATAYLLPVILFVFFGRGGNMYYFLAAVILLGATLFTTSKRHKNGGE